MKHSRSTLVPHFDKSRPVTVYTKVTLKEQWEHKMRVYFNIESVEVGIDTMWYCSICTYPSMKKSLIPVNVWVFGLVVNMIRCTQQGDWILQLVDDNVLLKVLVIQYTMLLPEGDKVVAITISQGPRLTYQQKNQGRFLNK